MPDFIFSNTDHYIVDIQNYLNEDTPKNIMMSDKLTDLYGTYINNYTENNNYNESIDTPVGCVIDMSIIPFDLTWNEMDMTWDDLKYNGITPYSNTWDNISYGDFYEIGWTITYEDPFKYKTDFRGKISEMSQLTTILPYTGKYTISLVLHDLRNFMVMKSKVIEVKQFNPNIIGFANFHNNFSTFSDVSNLTYNELTGPIVSPSIRHKTTLDDLNIAWDSLSLKKFNNTQNIVETQDANNIHYVMSHDVIEGQIIEIIDNLNFVYSGFNTNQLLSDGDWIFFKLNNTILTRQINHIVFNVSEMTASIELYNSVSINPGWTFLREIGNSIILNQTSNEQQIVKNDSLYFKSTEYNFPEYNIISGNESQLTLNNPITQLSGDLYVMYKKATQITGAEIIYNTESSPVSTIINSSNKWLIKTPTVIPEIILQNSNEGIIADTTNNLRFRIIDSIGLYTLVEWINGSPTSLDTAGLTIDFNLFHTLVKASNNTNITSDEITPSFYSLPINPMFLLDDTNWSLKKFNNIGSFNIKVAQRLNLGDKILLILDDSKHLLYTTSNLFKTTWSKFNIENANKHHDITNRSWDSLTNISWDDLKYHTWDDFAIHRGVLASFSINNVELGGRIKFNEDPIFEFKEIDTTNILTKYTSATVELNNSKNIGINKFNYKLITISPSEYRIDAIAKNYSISNLGYLQFTNGVTSFYIDSSTSHTFPIGDKHTWVSNLTYGDENSIDRNNAITSTYFGRGINTIGDPGWYPQYDIPEFLKISSDLHKIYPINFYSAITPNISWDNIVVDEDHLFIPIATTGYFTDDNSPIPGKKLRNWKLLLDGEILIETTGTVFSWFFDIEGEYTIQYTVSDTNGNTQKCEKQKMILVKKNLNNE